MKELIKKHRLIIEGSIVIIALALVLLYMYLPLFRKALGLRSEAKETEAKVVQEEKKLASYKETQGKLKVINDKITVLKKRFPATSQVPLVIQKLNQVAEKCNLEVSSVKPMPEISAPALAGYKEKIIEINLNGHYQELISFISEMDENFPWFLNINKFQIKSTGNDPEPQANKMSLSATFHTLIYTAPE